MKFGGKDEIRELLNESKNMAKVYLNILQITKIKEFHAKFTNKIELSLNNDDLILFRKNILITLLNVLIKSLIFSQ